MKLVIDIPEKDIPENLGTMEIHLSFCDGTVCQCDYPFEVDIEQLPSVSTEKTGQWTPYCYQNCECSICGYIISESDSEEFNFCPNCGTRMEVKK